MLVKWVQEYELAEDLCKECKRIVMLLHLQHCIDLPYAQCH